MGISALRDVPRFLVLSLAPQGRRLSPPDYARLLSDIVDSVASRPPVCVPPPGLPPQARRGALLYSSKRPAWRPGRTIAAFGDPAPRGSLPRTGRTCRYPRRAFRWPRCGAAGYPGRPTRSFSMCALALATRRQLTFQSAWLGLRNRPTTWLKLRGGCGALPSKADLVVRVSPAMSTLLSPSA